MPATKTYHPRRRNVTITMAGLKTGAQKSHLKNGEPQWYRWEPSRSISDLKKKKIFLKMVLQQLPCTMPGTGRSVLELVSPVLVHLNNNNNNNNNRIQRRYSRFFTISSQHRELSPTRTLMWPGRNCVQITCNTSSAYHVRVSCYVPRCTKGQLSY